MKILWASPNTLLDTANGAALAVRSILRQLSRRGWEVRILGATIFVNPNGTAHFREVLPRLKGQQGKFILFKDGELEHRLMVTEVLQRRLMRSYEEQKWFDDYCRQLDEFQPDLVMFFDNSLITLLTADEARRRGIPAVVYLAHPYNSGSRWCRDVNLMITDSEATAGFYRRNHDYRLDPVGTFVEPEHYKAVESGQTRTNVLFINPNPGKGAVFAIQLALMLERIRPDIRFEVVEVRSRWEEVLRYVTRQLGQERSQLDNVTVTPNVADMRPIYGRAKVLLTPSVWWESGPRVVVEALLNGIPVVGSNSGGIPENTREGGLIINFPEGYDQAPYDRLFDDAELQQASDFIIRLYDDPDFYRQYCQLAAQVHAEHHDIEKNTDRLLTVLQGAIDRGSHVLAGPNGMGGS